MANRRGSYSVRRLHDELIRERGNTRPAVAQLCKFLRNLGDKEIEEYKAATDLAIELMGITFMVYSDPDGCIDGTRPFDRIPCDVPEESIRRPRLPERLPGSGIGGKIGRSTVGG